MSARRDRGRNPFRGISDLVSEMNRMSERMVGVDGPTPQRERGHSDAWNPTTDILARGSDVIIRSELAGVSPDDVEVSLSHGILTVSGQRRHGPEDDDDYYLRERSTGWFRRDITLPEGIRHDQIEAQFTDGVLEVTVRGATEAAGPASIVVRT